MRSRGTASEHDWARITEWEPGRRIVLDWRPGLPVSQTTHVEIISARRRKEPR